MIQEWSVGGLLPDGVEDSPAVVRLGRGFGLGRGDGGSGLGKGGGGEQGSKQQFRFHGW